MWFWSFIYDSIESIMSIPKKTRKVTTAPPESVLSPLLPRWTSALKPFCRKLLEDPIGMVHLLQFHLYQGKLAFTIGYLLLGWDTRYLALWIDVLAFQKQVNTFRQRRELARAIFDKYFARDSVVFTAIPKHLLHDIGYSLDIADVGLFDELSEYLVEHLCRTSFRQFIHHELYRAYRRKVRPLERFVEVNL